MRDREWATDLEHVNWLNEAEDRAWQGQVKVTSLLFAQIERELTQESGLSLVDYYVLITLADAEDARLSMGGLAASLGWSRSRISHQVRRMEARGLVERTGNVTDRRGAFAHLTDDGLSALKRAVPGQVDRVRRHFIDQLTPDQAGTLASAYQSLLNHLATLADFPTPSRFEPDS
ncbi:MarR family transcriptional regulator [Mycobacterium sp. CBMA271]|uniref:MarR family winged helix-turn-helix transcriptional regulator n=1 Tax=unclassified Mycobacteroides TaxID=2618759 RepID=UPI0012DDCF7D|nr:MULTISPECIES: MarR family transcriptional regulator [unclassified Mycobacteroides]MUM17890.1 MarR family transcriptional regulator [Mycobacteroides sp. CBMA 326]MUM20460.1 MarR family transcriptional regulator [Mycobacteroides sp. CBMA 271]